MQESQARYTPAYERNHLPIATILRSLPLHGEAILEVGSGSGQHICHCAQHVCREDGSPWMWQPTEQAGELGSIRAWRAASGMSERVKAPVAIDLLKPQWEEAVSGRYAMVMSVNVAHIVSWEGVIHLIQGASRVLEPGGVLYFYGPFRAKTRELEPSNASFEAWLKATYEGAGIRWSEHIEQVARTCGLAPGGDVEMPSHNRSLWFKKDMSGG